MNNLSLPYLFDKKIDEGFLEGLVIPRFLRYVRYSTASDRRSLETPSTPGQWELARALAEELRALGVEAEVTEHCYVIASLPASPGREDAPAVGFLAHLDTSDEVSGEGVTPIVEDPYNGGPISLEGGLVLDPAEDEDLAEQKGKAIIHTDGSTLLGADDKAGIAEIMGAAEYLLTHPELPRGPVEIIFTPDEETGRGLPEFPLERLRAAACYTLDGGGAGDFEAECFNAWKASLVFEGRAAHLGKAKGRLANAALMAASFAAMLPRSESPEATDRDGGFYCPVSITGGLERAEMEVLVRDFDRKRGEERLAALAAFAAAVEAQFPGGKVKVETALQYENMWDGINGKPQVLAALREAVWRRGMEFILRSIRGGTDGARLTALGIPSPNIFTGGRNPHSRLEWASVPDMTAAAALVVELARVWSEAGEWERGK